MVYFTSLFELLNILALSTPLGARLRHKYRLSHGDVLDITNKLVSAVQALFCCITGAIVCLYSCTRDFIKSSHFMSEAYAWFGAAYFFYDIWSMYMVHIQMTSSTDSFKSKIQRKLSKNGDAALSGGDNAPVKKPSFLAYCTHEPVILFHHLFIGGFGFLVITYLRGGLGDCVFGYVYLMEVSTPFVSFRSILSRLKLKASRAYLVNGVLMLLTFFFCRVLSLPYVMLLYARVLGLPYFEASRAYLVNGVLMLLTFFFCRVLSLPYVMLLYARVLGLPYFEASRAYLVNGVLMLLTFFFCRVLSLPYVMLLYARVLGLPYFEVSVVLLDPVAVEAEGIQGVPGERSADAAHVLLLPGAELTLRHAAVC
ncbi:TLC domain-containing protein [Phthorimaea operculella]|nr:TLC domain-containing protein [Phthorimaea operculella]